MSWLLKIKIEEKKKTNKLNRDLTFYMKPWVSCIIAYIQAALGSAAASEACVSGGIFGQ